MHDEELIVFVQIGLWCCGDRTAIEGDNHVNQLGDGEGDETVAQVG
jgi:hypothetical protein